MIDFVMVFIFGVFLKWVSAGKIKDSFSYFVVFRNGVNCFVVIMFLFF